MRKKTKVLLFISFYMFFSVHQPAYVQSGKTVQELLNSFSLEEKAAQVMMVGFAGKEAPKDLLSELSVHSYGGVILFSENIQSPLQAYRLTRTLQTHAKIPLLISTDQEGGVYSQLKSPQGFTETCGNMALGATRDTKNAYESAKIIAEELSQAGINVNLAPVLDVNNNPKNPVIHIRSFGENPAQAASMGEAFVKGTHEEGVIAVLKHFPGHGDTHVDSHKGLPVVSHSLDRLSKVELVPFKKAIASGAQMVMTAHVAYTALDKSGLPATLSKPVVSGLLREELNFNGVVITDALEMGAIMSRFSKSQAVIKALNVGADMVLIASPEDGEREILIQDILAAVKKGELSEKELDEKVLRILQLKKKFTILDTSYTENQNVKPETGTDEHYRVSLQICEKGVTLLRNKEKVLPLKDRTKTVFVLSPKKGEPDPATGWESFFTTSVGNSLFQHHPKVVEFFMQTSPNREELERAKFLASGTSVVLTCTLNSRFSKEQTEMAKSILSLKKPSVLVALGMPYDFLDFSQANVYLTVYGYTQPALHAMANVLLGYRKPGGRLPVTLSKDYPAGFGVSL